MRRRGRRRGRSSSFPLPPEASEDLRASSEASEDSRRLQADTSRETPPRALLAREPRRAFLSRLSGRSGLRHEAGEWGRQLWSYCFIVLCFVFHMSRVGH